LKHLVVSGGSRHMLLSLAPVLVLRGFKANDDLCTATDGVL
jgi:hypothetical protein